MAMPFSRGKRIAAALRGEGEFPEGYRGSRTISDLTALFDACFRIQREASEAKGEHVPLIVENVRGAISKGRSTLEFPGVYHLWGDVPALMPGTVKGVKRRRDENGITRMIRAMFRGHGFQHDCRSAGAQRPSEETQKGTRISAAGSWFNIGPRGTVGGTNPDGRKLPGFRFDGSGRSFQTASVEAGEGSEASAWRLVPRSRLPDAAGRPESARQGRFNDGSDPDRMAKLKSSKSPLPAKPPACQGSPKSLRAPRRTSAA